MRSKISINVLVYGVNICGVCSLVVMCVFLINGKNGRISYLRRDSRRMTIIKSMMKESRERDNSSELVFDEQTTISPEGIGYNSTNGDQDLGDDYESVQLNTRGIGKGGKPLILLWNPLQYPSEDIPNDPICGGGCRLSKDRQNFNESVAIVFTMKEFNMSDSPKSRWRSSDQVFVWWSEESAWASNIMYKLDLKTIHENFFNWTMTYKKNSDVNAMMIPYNARKFVMQGLQQQMETNAFDSNFTKAGNSNDPSNRSSFRVKTEREIFTVKRQAKKFVKKKSRMAVWVASNCGYTAGAVLRRKLVTKLRFHGLDVDIFGECGDSNVPENLAEYLELLSQYRFYLAFENSFHCKDYITEKFWYNGLYAGTVPIVWGPLKSDLVAVAPVKSFIFYEDFETVDSLVQYLEDLSTDSSSYLEYFAWWWESPGYFPVYGISESKEDVRERKAIFDFEMNAFCHLCDMLNEEIHLKKKKSISSIHDWWYEGESEVCLSRNHGAKLARYGSNEGNKGYEVINMT